MTSLIVAAVLSGAALTEVKAPDAQHAPETRKISLVSSVAISPSGKRMWATWYAGKTDGEDSNNYCVLATSTVTEATCWRRRTSRAR